MMEIILKEDVANLGHKDDIVKVKPGYGRNYLIPQGMAVLATASARKVHAENQRQRAHKEEKLRQYAAGVATQSESTKLTIRDKASSIGKSFGSMKNTQIAHVR